jgi:N-acetylmuramoyl-L-alanine amidase
MEKINKNSSGEKVTDIQRRLRLLGYDTGKTEIDGIFGAETENAVRKFQQNRGLVVSGVMDQETWQELVDAGYSIGERMLYLKYPPFRGDDVRTLQLWLKTLGFYSYNENGIFCEKTHNALLEFQRNMNIADDGILGEETIRSLKGLKRIIASKETSNFPFIKNASKRINLLEYKIILDYSTNIDDSAVTGDYFNEKISICGSIINFCRDTLLERGVEVLVSVNDDGRKGVSLYDRIDYINKNNADLLISLDLNYSVDKKANGSSCFYFKGLKSYSTEGYRAASLIQDKIVSNLKVLDCRVRGTNHAILKATNLTSVLVEPAFISNYDEMERLKESNYRKKIGKSIVEGILGYLA